MRSVLDRAQLDLLRLCKPLTIHSQGEGHNRICSMCWMPIAPALDDWRGICTCWLQGCWECGAAVGEPGCEYCVDRDEVVS